MYHRGPVTCDLYATLWLDHEYKGGIWAEPVKELKKNHKVSIVGWGQSPEGVDYW